MSRKNVNNTMKKILLFLIISIIPIVGCQKQYVSVTDIRAKNQEDKNSCLVDAVVFQAAYNQNFRLKKFFWSKILIINWQKNPGEDTNGHALCVFVYNKNLSQNPFGDRLYVYDYASGTKEVRLYLKDKPEMLAKYLFPMREILKAYYLE